MKRYAFIFFAISLIAGIVGLSEASLTITAIGKILFFFFFFLFIYFFTVFIVRKDPPPSSQNNRHIPTIGGN